MLDFTDAGPFTEGQHVKLAVVGSGGDASHSQLPNVETSDVTGAVKRACADHGTKVAEIVVVQDRRNTHVPFLGLVESAPDQGRDGDPFLLAKGIIRAIIESAPP